MNAKTLMLIDLSGLAHPIWHTLSADLDPDARMRTGQSIVQRVHALVGGHPHAAICCDAGRSFRHDLEPEYKANRPERDEAFGAQVRQAQEVLAADGFPIWRVPGFEADDVIATATAMARAAGWEVQIVTADKDLLALVTEAAPVVRVRKPADGTIADTEVVAAKFGILPAQMTDFLTLVGDASDNIAGAKGIGPKKAADLLAKFHTLDDLVEALAAGGTGLTPSTVQALRDFFPRLEATRALVRMRTDVPLPTFATALEPRQSSAMVIDAEVADEPEDDPVESFMAAMDLGPAPKAETAPPAATQTPQARPQATPQPAPVVPAVGDVAMAPKAARPVVEAAPVAPTHALVPAVVTDLAPAPVEFERQLEPRSMAQAQQLAKLLFQSRMFSGYGNDAAVLSTMLMGRELGIQAMSSLRAIHNIDGKHGLSAQLMVALVLRSGLAVYVQPVSFSATEATWEGLRVGTHAKPITVTHTIEMAQTAGLVKPHSGWVKNPTDQLNARASSRLCRLLWPDVIMNLYTPEEILDMRQEAA